MDRSIQAAFRCPWAIASLPRPRQLPDLRDDARQAYNDANALMAYCNDPPTAWQQSSSAFGTRQWQTAAVTSASPTAGQNLVWIDLEMTGLDPQADVLLQAALVITTSDLTPLVETAVDIHQPEECLDRMTPLVRGMHTTTGLIDRVRKSIVGVEEAERLLLGHIRNYCQSPAILCGNSVWADRRFIAQFMPQVDRYLHYRILDVSSIKILAHCWYGASAVFDKPTAGAHDAIVDIHNSIAELRHYRRWLFREARG